MGDACNGGDDIDRGHTKLDGDGNPVELECYEFASGRPGVFPGEVRVR